MLRLHELLMANAYPNCRKAADDLEVSAKTVQRDLDFMRDRFGLPLAYDPLRFGFYYTEPVTAFPTVEVSEGEVISLFVAQKALEQYRGTSFEKPLRSAFSKISQGLRDRIEFQWVDLESAISFRGIGSTVADLELFETVSRAVLRSHRLVFQYKKLSGSKYEQRRVEPYHLGCIENQWYLFGLDLARQQIRTFALPRMRRVLDTRSGFLRPADFSITKYLSASFGVFASKSQHRVRIRFDAFAARLVAERKWHGTQKIKRLGQGAIELSMTLGGIEEVERWVLSWGEHATVLEPKALVSRIRKLAAVLGTRYGSGN
jgi:predicted DNA-binding transcriptional regulator YafY